MFPVIVSAYTGPGKSYYVEDAESFVYKRNLIMEKNGRLFQRVFLNQVEQQLPFLLQIQKLRANSMLSTTREYLSLMIQVFRGENVTSNGQKNMHIYFILQ